MIEVVSSPWLVINIDFAIEHNSWHKYFYRLISVTLDYHICGYLRSYKDEFSQRWIRSQVFFWLKQFFSLIAPNSTLN